ncbi:sigma-54-dependent transcriptional regulator [Rubinisphaera margarita]|uniref:sigma-54-dependent transcriptional regulator n=1 Tax=Rubinisphaera margarita TaxID=2909586 RepID=UPI001EE999D9|nr:sigma 54-interacting transcriptional regulator [Rubinisphaera margarita]MCG6155265.1 sigma 54-interacting transcriptional regulator [Rubinisphaera margarita]
MTDPNDTVKQAASMDNNPEQIWSEPEEFSTEMTPADATILIELQRELVTLMREAGTGTGQFLDSGLTALQRHLGAQGIIVLQREQNWTERASVSPRFVGKYEESLLDRAIETQRAVFLRDVPAASWAQIFVPLSPDSILVLAGRKFGPSDLEVAHLAGELLETLRQTLDGLNQLQLTTSVRAAAEQSEREFQLERARGDSELIGASEFLSTLKEQTGALTQLEFPLCLSGEPGAGKRAVGRYLHWRKSESPGLLVEFSPGNTDGWEQLRAVANDPGQGTILLNNVELLSHDQQEELRQLLGSAEIVPSSLRRTWLIVTTTADLQREVDAERFQESLYRRLTVCSLKVPALQTRADDVLPLAQHFLQQAFRMAGRAIPELSHAACEALLQHSWPGNVAELRTVMERLVWRGTGDTINANDLLTELKWIRLSDPSEEFTTLSDATIEFQRAYIRAAISKARGNMTEASRMLGLHRTNFYRKMHQLDMVEAGSTPQAALDS